MARLMKVLKEKKNSQLTEEQKQLKILEMRWKEISFSEKIWCIPQHN
ncbi:hypothetical protein [Orientia tsutsugamushi]|uniref:Integrase n=1 Tax=Orientia tsutsugamushi TaxID=784 RepID=A0A2U3QU65_ORITS|nr:hypothetical protein [Orientia tsutsugamushi]KJV70942.1 putative integrase [Orientia tsutsugamushi str. UT76]KJV54871.1 putative integrase [Orientia tsutsugamushi str. Karp]KJV88527.1 putative integrase [Orientia tsutsugamushi str. UT76]SPR03931.1 integrase [Orientia tsutsugamushi]SPR04500.1 integrase [Orientia tsutsugamushi]